VTFVTLSDAPAKAVWRLDRAPNKHQVSADDRDHTAGNPHRADRDLVPDVLAFCPGAVYAFPRARAGAFGTAAKDHLHTQAAIINKALNKQSHYRKAARWSRAFGMELSPTQYAAQVSRFREYPQRQIQKKARLSA
jgi:hypothetical protein